MKIDNSSNLSLDQILDMLTDVECELFHLSSDNPDNRDLEEAKSSARAALTSFAKAIGKIK